MTQSGAMIKAIIAIALSVAVGGGAALLARRSGKSRSASLLVGLTVGTAALGGFSPILSS
ncbi:hypothetical protein [Microtetraspora glauca]|uniref:Uncharacterized protein n=1 Tax=Microtetraspora glauca TaxID=1996 RepID=A0ABV3GTG8_MICGL